MVCTGIAHSAFFLVKLTVVENVVRAACAVILSSMYKMWKFCSMVYTIILQLVVISRAKCWQGRILVTGYR